MKACFFIGLGGTGFEILDSYTMIKEDFPSEQNIWEEYFCLDVISYTEITQKPEWKRVVDPQNPSNNFERYHQLVGFSDGRTFAREYKEKEGENTNIDVVFPEDDEVINNQSNVEGCWYRRKVGYLSLFSHLEVGDEIFFNIQNKVAEYMNLVPKNERLNVFVFILNSLAGGTGSGLFCPFTALLKKRLEAEFHHQDVHFNYLLIAVLPEVIKKGSRTDTKEKQMHYAANTYIALHEIKYLNSDKRKEEWIVQFNGNNEFKLNPEETLFNKIFLISDRNTESKTLHVEDYKPYFHMISWLLFSMARQSEAFLQKFGQAEGGFGSFGLSASEFPKSDLLKYQKDILLGEIGNKFDGIRIEDVEKVQDTAKDFNLSTMMNNLKDNLLHDWVPFEADIKNQLNRIKEPGNVKKAAFSKPDLSIKADEFEVKLKKGLEEFIIEKIDNNWSLRNLIGLVYKLKDLNKETRDNVNRLKEKNEILKERIFGDLDTSKNTKNARKIKIGAEQLEFETQVYEKIIGLHARIDELLENRKDFFKEFNSIFTRNFPEKWTTKEKPVKKRFDTPPSDLVWDKKEYSSLKDLAQFLENRMFARYGEKRDESFRKIVRELMSRFAEDSKKKIKESYQRQFTESFVQGFNTKLLVPLKNELEKRFCEILADFLNENLFKDIEDFVVNYPSSQSDDVVKKAQPFIQTRHKIGHKIENFIFANINVLDALNPDFSSYTKEKFMLPNNLIVFFSLVGNLSINDLEPLIANYRKEFEKLKNRNDHAHCFLDRRFEIFKLFFNNNKKD